MSTALSIQNLRRALQDISEGVRSVHLWPVLGWQEIRQRYRRSTIGPFWITLSTGALLAGMGPLYGHLLQQPIGEYFAYLAIGYVIWLLLFTLVLDACGCFISAEGYIKLVRLPFTVHVLRAVWKNLIVFAHNAILIVVVLVVFPQTWGWDLALVPLALVAIAFNAVWVVLLLGLLCARFRDIPPIVASVMQVALFVTPIMWKAEMLRGQAWVAQVNPLYHFIEVIRSPLLAQGPAWGSWMAIGMITAIGWCVTLLMFSKFRARIAYWL